MPRLLTIWIQFCLAFSRRATNVTNAIEIGSRVAGHLLLVVSSVACARLLSNRLVWSPFFEQDDPTQNAAYGQARRCLSCACPDQSYLTKYRAASCSVLVV